jgi:ferredoxin
MPSVNGFFFAVLILSLGYFSYNVQRLVGYLRLGRLDDVRWNQVPTRIGNFLRIGIFQEKIFRDSIAGPMHALIFWGFVILGASTTEMLITGVFPAFGFENFLPEPIYRLYVLSQEGFAAIVLAMVAMALWRRLTKRVPRLMGAETHPNDPLLILAWIGALMVTMFLSEAFHFVALPDAIASAFPVSYPMARVLLMVGVQEGMPAPQLMHDFFWWAHALLVLGFLNYLPFSKHLHVVASLPNTFLSNTSGPGARGAMRPLDFEGRDAEQFGASDVEHLSWKALLDGFACTECGRCTAVCPANITGKMLSPRKIVINVRERLEAKLPWMERSESADGFSILRADAPAALLEKPLLGGYITDEELWACTSCRACVYECPVSIDQLSIINDLRRNLVLAESRFPEEMMPAFESLETSGSPWAFDPGDRGK